MKILAPIALALISIIFSLDALAQETPEQQAIRDRMQEYREKQAQKDAQKEIAIRKNHERTWHRYGDIEIKRSGWTRRPDQVWMTEYKKAGNIAPGNKTDATLSWKNPRSFDTSLRELLRQGVISERDYAAFSGKTYPGSWIAISCRSLMVSRQSAKEWGDWMRPAEGTEIEQLVVDRCSTDAITVPPLK